MSDPNRRSGLNANVHRFRDYVAAHVGTGETVYMTPKQARTLARALHAAARDAENVPFAQSRLGNKTIEIN